MRRALLITALAAGATLPNAALAQSITAGGSIQGRIGYGDNPYLALNSSGNSAVAGGTLTGWLQRRTAISRTRLTGTANIDRNFQNYGTAENYLASLEHQQTLSAKLAVSGAVRFQDSINARFDQGVVDDSGNPITTPPDVNNLDLLSIGQRTRTISADGTVQWSPTSVDSFYFGPAYSRSTYPNSLASDFDTYSFRAGYLRRINERLQIGVDGSAQRVDSQLFPTSDSYNASLRLVYDFSAIWQFDGNVGLIHQSSSFGSSSTLGLGASMCGKYPSYRICVTGSRQSVASGFGGMRTDNRFGVAGNYELTSRSSINFSAVYDISESSGLSPVPKQKFWELAGGYSRTISDRLSAGFSGRYQGRDYGRLNGLPAGTATGYSVTLDVGYRFGRLE